MTTENVKPKTVRRSGIELLRIIAMLAIIVHHVLVYNRYANVIPASVTDLRSSFISGLGCFGKFGVGVFFIITGYFMAASKKAIEPKKKIMPIIRHALFYLFVSIVLGVIFAPGDFEFAMPPNGVVSSYLRIFTSGVYWFVGAYVLLVILSPYFKKMLDALSNKEVTRLCIIFALLASVGSDFCSLAFTGDVSNMILPTAFTFALIGYTLRRREDEIKSSGWAAAALLLGILLVFCAAMVRSYYNAHEYGGIFGIFYGDQATGTMLTAVGSFVIFSRMNWRSRFVNYIASSTFGVYLIHNSPFVADHIICGGGAISALLGKAVWHYSFPKAVAVIMGLSVALFVICAAIESLRRLAVRLIVKFAHLVAKRKPC